MNAASSIRHILVAAELSEDADRVALRAADLAKRYQSKVTLLHVVEATPTDLSNEFVLDQLQEIQEQLVKHAEQRLQEIATAAGLPDASICTARGSTKLELIHFARENAVDLIVIGSHARRGLARLLGSTANAVLHGAPCDVYVVQIVQKK
jgi:universal stress protein A